MIRKKIADNMQWLILHYKELKVFKCLIHRSSTGILSIRIKNSPPFLSVHIFITFHSIKTFKE